MTNRARTGHGVSRDAIVTGLVVLVAGTLVGAVWLRCLPGAAIAVAFTAPFAVVACAVVAFTQRTQMHRIKLILGGLIGLAGILFVHTMTRPLSPGEVFRKYVGTVLPSDVVDVRCYCDDPLNTGDYFIRFKTSAETIAAMIEESGLESSFWNARARRISTESSNRLPEWWTPFETDRCGFWSVTREEHIVRLIFDRSSETAFVEVASNFSR